MTKRKSVAKVCCVLLLMSILTLCFSGCIEVEPQVDLDLTINEISYIELFDKYSVDHTINNIGDVEVYGAQFADTTKCYVNDVIYMLYDSSENLLYSGSAKSGTWFFNLLPGDSFRTPVATLNEFHKSDLSPGTYTLVFYISYLNDDCGPFILGRTETSLIVT